jgi:hypothetical protein
MARSKGKFHPGSSSAAAYPVDDGQNYEDQRTNGK